ncbi:DNA repair and recombination protein RadB [archaeon]|nr:DNA repair and recombination protein RadB [archaeon]
MNFVPLECILDELLGGGLHIKKITQVYGPPGSGKTNIALQATVNAVKMGKKVVFIDSESGFSEERLGQIAGEKKQQVLDNTYLLEPASMREQGQMIKDLVRYKDVGLVVVDSIVYHYRLEMDQDKPRSSSRVLGRQLADLLELSRKKDLAVLVTNQVYTSIDTGRVEPVGGDTLKYGSKIVLELKPERKAKLIKHLFVESGKEKNFNIAEQGIV